MSNEEDLLKTIHTCAIHCRPGGVVLIVPDFFKETFKPSTHHGGHDSGDKGLRYLEWSYDPDPTDSSYISSMVYMIRKGSHPLIVETDQFTSGLFDQETWLRLFQTAGLTPEIIQMDYCQEDQRRAILGKKNR